MAEPLAGIRVLEMTTAVQGPAAALPPALGEANAEIMARLGFSGADIATVAARADELREAALAALSTQSS